MGIYIKGMEMPVTCCHCPLMGYDPDREWHDSMARMGAHICVLTNELIDNTKREDHCPLVPVPPHGRLGDLDELKTAFPCGESIRTESVRATIDHMPTIVPADEVI